jgi:phytoene synthase
MTTLAADHAACAASLRRSGSTFAAPIRLLPEAKRRGTTALYAFCRRADDLVDDAVDIGSAAVALGNFREATLTALQGRPVDDPILRAVVDTVRRFAVPRNAIVDILDGVQMDLDRQAYVTFADLEAYCRRVATAVGVAAIHIWGFTDPAAVDLAHDCGLAFQLTNILRDIPEDLGRGRIYLPEEDFLAAGCTPDDLRAGRIGPAFGRLAALSVDRATARFTKAEQLDRRLSTDGRIVFRAMFGVYRAILHAVGRAGTAIFTQRVRPTRQRALVAGIGSILLGPRASRWL